MTRRMRLTCAGTVLLAAGLAVGVHASSQNTTGGPPLAPRQMGPTMGGVRGPVGLFAQERRFLSRLNLSDAQKDQIRAIVQSHRADWRALADRAVEARRALQAAIAAGPVDEDAIRSRSAALALVQADIAVARAKARDEILQVLTPEQQAQARALQGQMATRMQRMRQRLNNRLPR